MWLTVVGTVLHSSRNSWQYMLWVRGADAASTVSKKRAGNAHLTSSFYSIQDPGHMEWWCSLWVECILTSVILIQTILARYVFYVFVFPAKLAVLTLVISL